MPSERAEELIETFRKALADYNGGKSPSDRPRALPVGTATVRHREECGTERQLCCVRILYCSSGSSASTEPESFVVTFWRGLGSLSLIMPTFQGEECSISNTGHSLRKEFEFIYWPGLIGGRKCRAKPKRQ
jgi:hypothetical protein